MVKVSVVVAVFNVEKYLERCLDSLVKQTLQNLEVILVDDGSTDNSGKLCDLYASSYDNIKVIHQDNRGLSGARNTGIKNACGNYLAFVDGDDYVDVDMYEELYNMMESRNVDVGICYHYHVIDNKIICIKNEGNIQEIRDKRDILKIMFQGNPGNISVCTKMFKRNIFNGISFREGKNHEDADLLMKWICASKSWGILNKCKYYYCHRTGSITSSSLSKNDADFVGIWKKNRNCLVSMYPELRELGDYRLFFSYSKILEKIIAKGDWELVNKIVYKLRSKYLKMIVGNRYVALKIKLAYGIMIVFPHLYYKMKKVRGY